MPEDKQGANGSVSPADKTGANGAGSPPLEELMAENKRKAEKIAKLEGDFSTYKETMEARLADLEEKTKLSPSEKKEKASLSDLVKRLREQAQSDPNTAAYLAAAEEAAEARAKKVYSEQRFSDELEALDEFLEEKASSLGMKKEDLEKAIDPFAEPYLNKGYYPMKRGQKALADYLKQKTFADEKAKFEAERLKEKQFRETGIRVAETQDGKKTWKDAKTREEKVALLDEI